jgi:uncharacterized glyoxalase superfamily protein PhnB
MSNLSPTLAVRDMKKTLDFYINSLGFKLGMTFPDANNPEYADLSKDGMVLMFLPAQNLGIGDDEKLGTGVNFYLEIDGDIDEYYRELQAKGVSQLTDIKDEDYGIRDFTVTDPDGYLLTFNRASAKVCLSCGMPMSQSEDFGGGNPNNIYCAHCTNPDGSLKTYEEVLEGMIHFMMTNRNLDHEAAEQAAREYMTQMPAWL